MDLKIIENNQHQSQTVVQFKASISDLMTDADPFMPFITSKKLKKHVSYANMAKRNPKSDTSRSSSPMPMGNKKPRTVNVSKSASSKGQIPATKKLNTIAVPKTIQTVLTGYSPETKDNIHEITVYDIPFTWSQIDILNYLKAWYQVIAIKFKSQ